MSGRALQGLGECVWKGIASVGWECVRKGIAGSGGARPEMKRRSDAGAASTNAPRLLQNYQNQHLTQDDLSDHCQRVYGGVATVGQVGPRLFL